MNWRNTKAYRIWRDAVIDRDKCCQTCGATENLHVHHKNHATYFPDERFDVNNGVTQCEDCHSNYHNNYHRSNRVKCTKHDFENFLSLVRYLRKVL